MAEVYWSDIAPLPSLVVTDVPDWFLNWDLRMTTNWKWAIKIKRINLGDNVLMIKFNLNYLFILNQHLICYN